MLPIKISKLARVGAIIVALSSTMVFLGFAAKELLTTWRVLNREIHEWEMALCLSKLPASVLKESIEATGGYAGNVYNAQKSGCSSEYYLLDDEYISAAIMNRRDRIVHEEYHKSAMFGRIFWMEPIIVTAIFLSYSVPAFFIIIVLASLLNYIRRRS